MHACMNAFMHVCACVFVCLLLVALVVTFVL